MTYEEGSPDTAARGLPADARCHGCCPGAEAELSPVGGQDSPARQQPPKIAKMTGDTTPAPSGALAQTTEAQDHGLAGADGDAS